MPTIRQTEVLNAPPERVWEFVTALRYLPVWMADVAAVREISTPQTAAGTTYTLVRRGRRDPETWIVADWEPPRRVRLSEVRRHIQLVLELEPDAQGTRLSMQQEWPSNRGLLDRLLPPTARRQALERSLARLKELVALNQDIKLLYGMGDE
ncbi:MAG: SRPBCC family protein [Chloroflexota bacterium]|nr:SRPBCC family protein [Chloroflexota bacterium]